MYMCVRYTRLVFMPTSLVCYFLFDVYHQEMVFIFRAHNCALTWFVCHCEVTEQASNESPATSVIKEIYVQYA